MKKIMYSLMAIMIMISNTCIVYAQEDYCFESRTIFGLEGVYYTIPNDPYEYFVVNDGDEITVYNLSMNTISGVASFDSRPISIKLENNSIMNSITPLALIDDYDKWPENFYLYATNSLEIGDIESAAYSTIVGYIVGLLNPLGGAAAGFITSIATICYNNKYGNLTAKVYQRTNLYCSILVQRYTEIFEGTTKIRTSDVEAVWLNSPWDYVTYPNACRVLTERY